MAEETMEAVAMTIADGENDLDYIPMTMGENLSRDDFQEGLKC
jgi:hypothetical protein